MSGSWNVQIVAHIGHAGAAVEEDEIGARGEELVAEEIEVLRPVTLFIEPLPGETGDTLGVVADEPARWQEADPSSPRTVDRVRDLQEEIVDPWDLGGQRLATLEVLEQPIAVSKVAVGKRRLRANRVEVGVRSGRLQIHIHGDDLAASVGQADRHVGQRLRSPDPTFERIESDDGGWHRSSSRSDSAFCRSPAPSSRAARVIASLAARRRRMGRSSKGKYSGRWPGCM